MKNLHLKYVNETYDENGLLSDISFNVPDDFYFAYDVLDNLAKEKPNHVALMWRNEEGEARNFTFSEMKSGSDRAAKAFQDAGIKKGDMVMLILKRHYHFWFAMMGLNKIGAIAIPATNQLQVKDLVYRFQSANVKAIVSIDEEVLIENINVAIKEVNQPIKRFVVGRKRGEWLSFNQEIKNNGDFKRLEGEERNVKDMMLLYFTSGTTGMPKMVTHDNSYPIAHIVTAKYWHNVCEDKPHLTVSETGWAKSVWGKLYGQWFMESIIYVYDMDRFNPEKLLEKMQDDKVATFCAPPTIYRMLIKEDLSRFDLSSLCYATVAGEALNPEVFNKFLEQTGISLMEGFGQTETTLTVATLKGQMPKIGSMGKPSPAYKVIIADDEGKQVRNGVIGEICLDVRETQVGLFMGYYKDDERTDSVCYDGIYHTGDMAWQDEDGYLFYMSRIDDVIKSSGYRIGPFEVESVIMEHPSVLECAVTGTPDPVRGMAVKATIVLAKGFGPSEELKKDIQKYVKTHTAPYKYPRVIDFVTELPKTISGKIRRVQLREE